MRPADVRGRQQHLHGEHGVLQPQLHRGEVRGGELLGEWVRLLERERVLYRPMYGREVRGAERVEREQQRGNRGRRQRFDRVVERWRGRRRQELEWVVERGLQLGERQRE
jgi:hypothetical protein